MSEGSIKNPPLTDNSFGPKKIVQDTNLILKFKGNCLWKSIISFIHEKLISLYNV